MESVSPALMGIFWKYSTIAEYHLKFGVAVETEVLPSLRKVSSFSGITCLIRWRDLLILQCYQNSFNIHKYATNLKQKHEARLKRAKTSVVNSRQKAVSFLISSNDLKATDQAQKVFKGKLKSKCNSIFVRTFTQPYCEGKQLHNTGTRLIAQKLNARMDWCTEFRVGISIDREESYPRAVKNAL